MVDTAPAVTLVVAGFVLSAFNVTLLAPFSTAPSASAASARLVVMFNATDAPTPTPPDPCDVALALLVELLAETKLISGPVPAREGFSVMLVAVVGSWASLVLVTTLTASASGNADLGGIAHPRGGAGPEGLGAVAPELPVGNSLER